MKNVSTAFRNELNNDNRHYIKSCDITLSDGTKLSIDNTRIWDNGFKVEDDVSNSGSFDIGSAIIGKFTLTLNNIYDDFSEYDFTGAEITNVKVGLELPDGTIESVKEGIFTVDEPTHNGSIITLECLDNMSKFDRPYSESKLIYPATLGAIVRDACYCCGVSLAADSASFDGYDTVIQSRPDGDDSYTFRQVLSWVGQISCHWCRCNVNGELSLGWYDTVRYENLMQSYDGGTFEPWSDGDDVDGGTFDPWSDGDDVDGGTFDIEDKYHHIYSIASRSVSTDDVVITGIRVVQESSEGNDIIYQSGTDGYVLSIEENRFIQGDMGSTVAASLGEKLIGLKFRPLSLSCLSDPSMEAGDIAAVSDRKGNTYFTLITSTTFQAGNYQKVSCDAETPSRNSAARFSKATQIYRELRKSLAKQKTEWEKAVEGLGNRLDSKSGLYSTVEEQEDGSSIYYLHDKPFLEESMVVWKMTSQAWGVSTDGGETWNGGMTVDGEVIARILNTIGLNADWINTGALTVKDEYGNILFMADIDTGNVIVGGNITLGWLNNKKGSMTILDENGNTIGKWDKDGIVATAGKFSGELSGATGKFSGELSGATGKFSGELSGATGSFSGSVTATSGKIAGWIIEGNTLKSSNGSLTLNPDGSITSYDEQTGRTLTISGGAIQQLIVTGNAVFEGMASLNGGGSVSGTFSFTNPPKLYNLTHVSSGGHLVFASDGVTLAYLDSSSRRYKDIGREMTDEDVEAMYGLPVVWAKYKDGRLSEEDERCGKLMPMFVAEDVDDIFPIAADHKGGMAEDWNYRVMIPIMFQMLKSQKREIEELKKKINQ